VKITKK